jgi:hypothetical protein
MKSTIVMIIWAGTRFPNLTGTGLKTATYRYGVRDDRQAATD